MIKTYIIYDKELEKQWIAPSAKAFWKTQGHAKSAWNNARYHTRANHQFKNQTRYVCMECDVIPMRQV